MKRILVTALLVAGILTGCGTATEVSSAAETKPQESSDTKVVITNQASIETVSDPADMSGYQWLNDPEPAFAEITWQESMKMFTEQGSGILVYSYESCPWCNRAIPVLNEILKEYGVKAYYIDTTQPLATDAAGSQAVFHEFTGYISSILEIPEDGGDPTFYVPEVIAVKDGQVVGHHTSLVDSFELTDSDAQMDEAQTEELRGYYRQLIEACAD